MEKSGKAEKMHPFRSGSPCGPILLDSLRKQQCWSSSHSKHKAAENLAISGSLSVDITNNTSGSL